MVQVAVVGGGAAGMMAAIRAAEKGAQVTLLEKKEKPGMKLYITGKGRCNLTNACSREEFFDHIYRNGRFLRSSFSRFGNREMMDYMEGLGVKLVTERGRRVFPASNLSAEIRDALRRAMDRNGVKQLYNTQVLRLDIRDGAVCGLTFRHSGGREETRAFDRVIVATGGLSYPSTGSTGDGLRFAREAGLKTEPCYPSLVPLEAVFAGAGSPPPPAGLSLRNVGVRLARGKKILFEDLGEMMFTHTGVTGPLILSASAFLGEALREESRAEAPVLLSIDLKPALSREQLRDRFLREAPDAGKKQLSTLLGGWMPRALIPVVLAQAGLEGDAGAQLRREERERLLETVKALRMEVTSLGSWDEAVVTRGGVSVREIDPADMSAKKIKHLYFAGEVLDLDASTGGFNLQIAWTTGRAAGEAAAGEEIIMNRHIAIDGPAGSGKSTIARRVAKKTGLIYVDTGAMYRALAVHFLRCGLEASDEAGISAAVQGADVTIDYENGMQQVFLNGENVTPLLRQEEVGRMASASSVYAPVREKMKVLQQALAASRDVVMDGRDIGTVILPDAFLKIYMTADVSVRAKRRFDELAARGETPDLEQLGREIAERDWRDMHREIAPLRQAKDAVRLDTSALSIDEVVETVMRLYTERMK
ncbi:MAG: (d)CMP kinase [Lachnospiraceae bacterium]|nr:(d)CMP kinase [Lachnospiraceae bacterium]